MLLTAALSVALYLIANLTAPQTGALRVAEIALYWFTLLVAAGSPVIALCRLDPGHLHIPGDRRATAGLAAVAAGHVIGGIAGLLATTTANHVLAASQVGLAALALLALTDLSARSTGNPAMGTS